MTAARKSIGARHVRAFMQTVQVARLMCEREIHRVAVVDGAAVVGVVTSFDVLRAFSQGRPRGEHTVDYDPSA